MNIDPITILAHIVNIIILFVFLRWLLYKPVKKFIDARSAEFDERRANIAYQEEEIEKQKAKYEELMAGSQNEANELVRQSRDNANKRAEVILEDARQSAKDLMEHTRQEIANERNAAQARMREEVADLAIGIATRVLEREVEVEDNEKIIENFFSRERIG
jgi:F-type H+-transporting ATPase subunit b